MCFVFQTRSRKLCYSTSFRDLKKEQSQYESIAIYIGQEKNIFQYFSEKILMWKKINKYIEPAPTNIIP